MALSKIYNSRLNALEAAIQSFTHALERDISHFNKEDQDVFRNGQVQKFESSLELLWKVMKQYLYEKEGVDERFPKSVFKAFYQATNLPINDYEQLLQMIDHRNLFSHVYNEAQFLELYQSLSEHAKVMKNSLALLKELQNSSYTHPS